MEPHARLDTVTDGPYVVNVGLPRTGTSSFAAAVQLLRLPALHIWGEAEHDQALLSALRHGEAGPRQTLSSYAALSDSPFYLLAEAFSEHFPETAIIQTTRPRHAWVESMLRHGMAGGRLLADAYDLPGPPHLRDHQMRLERAWESHRAAVGDRVPTIDLTDRDEDRWTTLCRVLPDGDHLIESIRNNPWPWEERLAS